MSKTNMVTSTTPGKPFEGVKPDNRRPKPKKSKK